MSEIHILQVKSPVGGHFVHHNEILYLLLVWSARGDNCVCVCVCVCCVCVWYMYVHARVCVYACVCQCTLIVVFLWSLTHSSLRSYPLAHSVSPTSGQSSEPSYQWPPSKPSYQCANPVSLPTSVPPSGQSREPSYRWPTQRALLPVATQLPSCICNNTSVTSR